MVSPDSRIEKYTWIALVASVAAAPLAVAAAPFLERPFMVTVFAYPQNLVLAVGLAVALVLWTAALWVGHTRLVVSRPMIAFAALVVWGAVATFASLQPLRSAFGRSSASLSLIQILMYAALLFLVTQLVDSRERMRVLTWAVMVSGTAVALLGLGQQIFGITVPGLPLDEWVVGRGTATIGNPDHLANFLVLPTIVALVLAVGERPGRARMGALACLGILLAAVTGTLTRGAWVAVAFGAALAAFLLWRNARRAQDRLGNWPLVVAGVCVAAVAVALVASDPADLRSRFATGGQVPATPGASGDAAEASDVFGTLNAASSDRLDLWRTSLRMAGEWPLTGTGPDGYDLGWYGQAVDQRSYGGEIAVARDPHSLYFLLLATIGVPGVLAFLIGVGWAVAYGTRTSRTLTEREPFSGTSLYYVSWFAGTTSLLIALLLAAVSTPILMYAFLGVAVLLRPLAAAPSAENAVSRYGPAGLAILLAVFLAVPTMMTAVSELGMADALREGSLDRAAEHADRTPWNIDVQMQYFHSRAQTVTSLLQSGSPGAPDGAESLVGELQEAETRQPHEFYFPSVRTQILASASQATGDTSYASAAVQAADEALAIMPVSILTRVNKAIALSTLERFEEMADTLEGYWEYEQTSAYPGILYAQALAYSDRPQDAEGVFSALESRFPADAAAIEAARQEVRQELQ